MNIFFPLVATIAPPRMRRVAFVAALIATLIKDPRERVAKAEAVNNERHIADDVHAFDIGFYASDKFGFSKEMFDQTRRDWCARLMDFGAHKRRLSYSLQVMELDIKAVAKLCL